MSDIDNTTARMRDPAEKPLFLAESMGSGGPGAAIEHSEREGQRQLVNSDRLPTDRRGDFEALGFTFGAPDERDPMFCPATLPEGWRREGSDHAMWSYLVDAAGRQRVAIFYKAAFYDRSAFMRLESLDWYVTKHVEYGEPLIITDEWATAEAVAEALATVRAEKADEAAKYRRYAEENHRNDDNRAKLREIAAEYERTAAKYRARLEAL